jgi:hypothetical protein
MPALPIVHFSGKFRFHMPEYNNGPAGQAVAFDPALPVADVLSLCGCDPSKYFDFQFFDTRVTQVTKTDLSLADESELLLGKQAALSAFMVDVSPSAICAQLHAAVFTLDNLPPWKMSKATQSDLRLNFRSPGKPVLEQFSDETAGAWFDAELSLPPLPPSESAVIASWREAGLQKLFIRFHLNRYTRLDNEIEPDSAHLTGDVYGYIRGPLVESELPDNSRAAGRRIVAHPELKNHPEVAVQFLADPTLLGNSANIVDRRTDIDGTYDILLKERALLLHPLDFISFTAQRDGSTPPVEKYAASLDINGAKLTLGEFKGTHTEFLANGGLVVLPIPADVGDVADARLVIDVIFPDGSEFALMRDPEWDLVLESSSRGAVIASGESVTFAARIFHRNKPATGITVNHRTGDPNRRSPVVARVASDSSVSDSEGRISVLINALNLENAPPTQDPVTQGALSGDLPWDRYYGNFCFLSIPSPERWTQPPLEVVELAIRVIHKVDVAQMPDTPSFAVHILPIFSYYTRYFPWLHTRRNGEVYERFLDLSSFDEMLNEVEGVIARLSRVEDSRSKMPRSRDFPKNGVDLLKRWNETGLNP